MVSVCVMCYNLLLNYICIVIYNSVTRYNISANSDYHVNIVN